MSVDAAVGGSAGRRGRRAARQQVRLWSAFVRDVTMLSPAMTRVTVAGPDLADFESTGTDQHVKLYIYPDGVRPPRPLTMHGARAAMHRARPAIRSYTIRRYDRDAGEIDIDFVLHDDPGPASRWAVSARAGDELIFAGPSPSYQPAGDVEQYLLAGDSSALPAIEATAAELPAGGRATVLVEVADPAEHRKLPSPARLTVSWVRPGGLLPALRDLELDPSRAEAWIAAERDVVRAARGHLLDERRMERTRVRPTAYWRVGSAGT